MAKHYKNYLGEPVTNCPKGEGFCNELNHLTKKQYQLLQKTHTTINKETLNGLEQGEENIVYVEDNWGSHFELKEGVLDDQARYIFRNGQCLALATQLAKHFGTDKITVVSMITESDDYDDVYEREGKEPIEEAYRHIIHAYANADDGDALWDVDGEIFKDSVEEEYNTVNPNDADLGDYIIETYSIDGAKYMFEGFMTEQDYSFAQTILPSLFGKHSNS